MIVVDCLGTAQREAQALGAACAEVAGTVLLLQLGAAPSDPYEDWVVAGTVAVLDELRSLQRDAGADAGDRNPVTVVCAGAAGESPAAEALFEAVRGILQSLTLEPEARCLRCNVVRAGDAGDERVGAILRYLASPDGGFAIGTTLDLGGAS
jgi:hypothetical protein